jgi:glycosyltransferase involved in cell wall biosynthesis
MQHPLVSILTPMYNTEKYVHRLLDSVLSQDYPAIEMVVVDDGSTDGSRAVVEGYAGRFAAKGYTLRCYHQPNSGQSVAVKNGLRRVTGTYLAWPDSDDYYTTPDAITKMVRALEVSAPEFQIVRTQVRYVKDPSLELLRIEGLDAREEEEASLFEDCLFHLNGFYYCAGSYLVRTAVMKDLTGFDIYTEKNAGQNWQLLVPVLYRYRCKTVMEPLFTVLERSGSHTRGQYDGFQRELVRKEAYLRTQMATLERIGDIPEEKRACYLKRLQALSDERILGMAIHLNNRSGALERLRRCMDEMDKAEYRAKLFCLHLPGGTRLLNAYKDLHHRLHLLKKSLKKRA